MWVDKGNSWWKAEENILIKHLSVLLGFGDFFFVVFFVALEFVVFCCFVRFFSGRNANGSLKLLRMLKTVSELKIPAQITDKMLSKYGMPYWYAE